MSKGHRLTKHDIRQLPKEYQAQIAIQLTKRKRVGLDELQKKIEAEEMVEGMCTPVDIEIRVYRRRLLDSGNHRTKAVIDGIVRSGLLPDDRPEFVPYQPVVKQFKIGSKEAEYTEIEIKTIDK